MFCLVFCTYTEEYNETRAAVFLDFTFLCGYIHFMVFFFKKKKSIITVILFKEVNRNQSIDIFLLLLLVLIQKCAQIPKQSLWRSIYIEYKAQVISYIRV